MEKATTLNGNSHHLFDGILYEITLSCHVRLPVVVCPFAQSSQKVPSLHQFIPPLRSVHCAFLTAAAAALPRFCNLLVATPHDHHLLLHEIRHDAILQVCPFLLLGSRRLIFLMRSNDRRREKLLQRDSLYRHTNLVCSYVERLKYIYLMFSNLGLAFSVFFDYLPRYMQASRQTNAATFDAADPELFCLLLVDVFLCATPARPNRGGVLVGCFACGMYCTFVHSV
jgi:hypothetical protein